MKKIILNTLLIVLISIMIFPLSVSAKSISTIETVETNGKITVSGTTESGVLAIAILTYSGDELVYMETCNASDSSYSCTLNNIFSKGDYVVKVADYDGGNYAVDDIKVLGKSNPQTGDGIMNSIIVGSISLISLLGAVLYTKKKRVN